MVYARRPSVDNNRTYIYYIHTIVIWIISILPFPFSFLFLTELAKQAAASKGMHVGKLLAS
jgi:hypothetical protein